MNESHIFIRHKIRYVTQPQYIAEISCVSFIFLKHLLSQIITSANIGKKCLASLLVIDKFLIKPWDASMYIISFLCYCLRFNRACVLLTEQTRNLRGIKKHIEHMIKDQRASKSHTYRISEKQMLLGKINGSKTVSRYFSRLRF